MRRRQFIPLILPILAFANGKAYEEMVLDGWTVVVSRKLLLGEEKLAQEALGLLESKLKEVSGALPAGAVRELRKVRVWLEHPDDGVAKCAAYHPSAKWLENHGHNPEMAKCVEFGNPKLFIKWSETQPSMVLHELAHAYHHQVLTYKYKPIREAYDHALAQNLYADIKHANGKTQRAYALTNEKEFFAELTEAYFGRNDMYPFVRSELETYDPKGFAMVKAAWKA